jgi:hypothetical protein
MIAIFIMVVIMFVILALIGIDDIKSEVLTEKSMESVRMERLLSIVMETRHSILFRLWIKIKSSCHQPFTVRLSLFKVEFSSIYYFSKVYL